jgi:hypothetical protein
MLQDKAMIRVAMLHEAATISIARCVTRRQDRHCSASIQAVLHTGAKPNQRCNSLDQENIIVDATIDISLQVRGGVHHIICRVDVLLQPYQAVSFVRTAQDVDQLRCTVRPRGN